MAINKCNHYFRIVNIPEQRWVSAAMMHLEGNAAKWLQAYKQTHVIGSWSQFYEAMKTKFGSDDYRSAFMELIAFRQTGLVEEYTTQFQSMQFDISLHNAHNDEFFFASHYVHGLKEEIRVAVEPHVPRTVDRAAVIAKFKRKCWTEGNLNPIDLILRQKGSQLKLKVGPMQIMAICGGTNS